MKKKTNWNHTHLHCVPGKGYSSKLWLDTWLEIRNFNGSERVLYYMFIVCLLTAANVKNLLGVKRNCICLPRKGYSSTLVRHRIGN